MTETSLGASLEPPDDLHCPECEGCVSESDVDLLLYELEGCDRALEDAYERIDGAEPRIANVAGESPFVLEQLYLALDRLDAIDIQSAINEVLEWCTDDATHDLCHDHLQALDPRIP